PGLRLQPAQLGLGGGGVEAVELRHDRAGQEPRDEAQGEAHRGDGEGVPREAGIPFLGILRVPGFDPIAFDLKFGCHYASASSFMGRSMMPARPGASSPSMRTIVTCIHTAHTAVSTKITKKVEVGKPDQSLV